MKTHNKQTRVRIALGLLLALSLAGCGDDNKPVGGAGGTGGNAGQGGTDVLGPDAAFGNDSGDEDASAGGAGHGGSAGSPPVCEDEDHDGYRDATCGGDDCNDNDDTVHPGAAEVCSNQVDDDCNDATNDHPDADADGYDCVADCNDAVRAINPGRPEVCGNGIDDDCNGGTPDVRDLDNDGFGCDVDCDETRSSVNPAADELCGTGIDEDCNPTTPDIGDVDQDGILCTYDCDDSDETVPTDSYYCGASFSYFEGFENGPGGWTVSGRSPSWQHGTPAGGVIKAAASGQYAWVTGIDPIGYNDSEASFLTSPSFDFGMLAEDPVLRFSRIVWIGSFDGVWIEMSVDGGNRWDRLPESSIDENLYGADDDLGFSDSPTWLTATTRLTGAAGYADVRVRLVMFSDDSNTYEGFGFDNVRITDQTFDASVDGVILPPPRCADRSAEVVSVAITNHSSTALTTFAVSYSIDNGAAITQVVNTPIASGASDTVTFSATANLSVVGRHTVRAWVTLNGVSDEDRSNDASEARTHTFAQAGAPDYAESFETNDGNWVGLGTRSSWARGTPIGDPIDGASDGNYAWVTNPYGVHNRNEVSTLNSPCFDFASLTEDPVIAFGHLFSLSDGAHTVEVSVDGQAFTKVGSGSSPGGVNWYDEAGNDEDDDSVWDERSSARGDWREARHPLAGTAGAAQVQVRFTFDADSGQYGGVGVDNVRIMQSLVDARVLSVTFPEIECQGRNSQVRMRIQNGGNRPLDNFNVSYQLDDGTPVTEVVTDPIAPSGEADYTFNTPLSIDSLGEHTVTVRTHVSGQVDAANAIATHTLNVRPIVSGLDYRQDFESNDGNWITLGAGSQWEYGRPQQSFADEIVSAGSGDYAWVTQLFGDYGPNWTGDLVPPCFDFTGYSQDPVIRFDHIFHSEDADPMTLEMSTDGLTWSSVLASSGAVGWYNRNGNTQWSGVYDETRQWHVASSTLVGTAGGATVQLRYRLAANGSNTMYEGHGIDTVAIGNSFVDVRTTSVTSIGQQCSAATTVSAQLRNQGTAPLTAFDVAYQIDNGSTVVEHITATVNVGATYDFFASAPSILSVGTHTIRVTAIAASDASPGNNTASGTMRIRQGVSAMGYSQGFESNNGGWTVSGDDPSWAWGTPSNAFIDAAASGTHAWVTNLSGDYNAYERSYLTTACFDFADFNSDPQIQFAHIFALEDGYDYGWVEISTDGGNSFEPLGEMGFGTNWYNDDGWTDVSGSAGAWQTARYPLDGIAGERSVVFRFVMDADGSVQDEGSGIDDFAIVP